ncbi:MAG: FecR domain-containing protein [Deltaproteobacteria bacterium]|nr:FecR domain-containing protein [Deltaproteobacteria bacterium]
MWNCVANRPDALCQDNRCVIDGRNATKVTRVSSIRIRRIIRTFLTLHLYFLVSAAAWGCDGCSNSSLATLTRRSGNVTRDTAHKQNQWVTAQKGTRFFLNDGIRTGASSTAELWLRDGSGLRMEPQSMIRFSKTAPGNDRIGLRIEEGVIIIDAASESLEIGTRYGTAILEKGSRIKLTRGKDGITMDVEIGKARFISATEDITMVEAGQRIHATLEMAVVIKDDATVIKDDATVVIPDDALKITDTGKDANTIALGDASAQVKIRDTLYLNDSRHPGVQSRSSKGGNGDGTVSESDQPPPHMAISAGESAWIHVTQTSIHVSIRFADLCPNGGAVKIAGQRSLFAGATQAVIPLVRGKNTYSVFCMDSKGQPQNRANKKGQLYVVKDTGNVRLVLIPPLSTILMDGRTYNVSYQSRLPAIRIKWPTAPQNGAYTLHVTGSATSTLTLTHPTHVFESGELAEGKHSLKFVDEKTGMRSRTTTIKINFDNVSDKAALNEPKDGTFASGQMVHVSGMSIPGWRINAPNGDIAVDKEGRFGGWLKQNTAFRGIWIKLSHPHRGIHYYLRRTASTLPYTGE